ncbi:transposable element Tc1 transposase [Trichonephila clavipes]|nr:transposable element Tc1 transposase [Trichonephila clavipes]
MRWAQEHQDWFMDKWERVAWSDESRFVIHPADGRIRIRRLPGEKLLPQCTVGHTQAGGGSIMLWGTFSWTFLGPVVVVKHTMNATGYLNIITDQLHPYVASVFPAGNGMFQQDNAPCHKAKIVLEWFQKRDVIANCTCVGPGNIRTGSWISGRELPGQMNHGLSFIPLMVVSGYAVFQAKNCSPNVQ